MFQKRTNKTKGKTTIFFIYSYKGFFHKQTKTLEWNNVV